MLLTHLLSNMIGVYDPIKNLLLIYVHTAHMKKGVLYAFVNFWQPYKKGTASNGFLFLLFNEIHCEFCNRSSFKKLLHFLSSVKFNYEIDYFGLFHDSLIIKG